MGAHNNSHNSAYRQAVASRAECYTVKINFSSLYTLNLHGEVVVGI